MAESRKGASSATDLGKNDSLLDKDIGDEFMNSWKSISVADDDDMMDFSFGRVSKGKNKAFDFGALDVDFNLDSSFEKLSSFKIDMHDLDFSSPPKKTEKARSTGKEEPSKENLQKDTDILNFSFDFKELDSFDVDKSSQSGERTSKLQEDTMAVSSSRVELEAHNIHIPEENTTTHNSIMKRLPASKDENSSEVENFQADHGELESEVADGTSHEERYVATTTNKEQYEKCCISEKEASKSSHLAIHDVPARRIVRNDAPESTPEPQSEICMGRGELTVVSSGTENVTDELRDSDVTCQKGLPQSNLFPTNLSVLGSNHTEKDESEISPRNEVVDSVQLAEVQLHLKDCFNADLPRKLQFDTQEIIKNQNLKSKVPVVPSFRGPQIDKVTIIEKEPSGNSTMSRTDVISKPQLHQASSISTKLSTLGKNRVDAPNQIPAPGDRGPLVDKVNMKEKEPSGNSSISKTDVISKPQLHQSSSISTKLSTLGKNRVDAANQIPTTGDRNLFKDARPHNKVVNTAPPVVVQSEKSLGKLSKLVNTAPPVVVRSEKSLGKLSSLSARVFPENSCVKTTKTHENSELPKLSTIPSQSVKNNSAQRIKLSSNITSSIFPNLSSLKTSRAFEGKQVLSSTGGVKERKLGESEQTKEAGQTSKKIDIGFCAENAEKQKLTVSNMKRKAPEEPTADSMLLKPLKHLCVSPSGFRNVVEPLEKQMEQVESMTTTSHDQFASNVENSHVPNKLEVEISLVLENDRNVEKAEAYSQQLEDICNMLRKKQDEAKEILVRAIVNNNNLLMLNHPIYEEKIRKVQKFAATLLSKKLQAKAA